MDRSDLLAHYRGGADALVAAVSGLSEDALDSAPADGGWTVRQVVHHLADSEATAYVRLRRLLAEDAPLISGYDEEAFARRLHYDRPLERSLAVVIAVRAASLELLESLAPAEWDRAGTHSESGAYSVDRWLVIYAAHPYDHAEQIMAAVRGPANG
jgi:uncharacterized damage-inducible protein DinB